MYWLQQYRYHLLFLLAAIAYIAGLFVDVINIDSAQYASISQELLQNNSWLQIMHRKQDYLDKPPLLFWLSAISFKIFGVSNWAFKLPTFLFTCIGVYATYRLALLYYAKNVAVHAALIIASCQAYFLFNNDVRTDALLTACVITAAWQLAAYLQSNGWYYFVGACLFAALGMLAKGPIALMILIWTFGTQLILTKEWKKIFQLKWLLGLVLILIVLLPMSYGLYMQHGWKGVKFFYWTQSFGRITGESEWNNGAGYFFFTHTFLWAFLPWSIISVAALFSLVKQFITQKKLTEYICLAGFTLTFVALSLSKYKLPHYIFVTFPFAAIFTAQYLHQSNLFLKWLKSLHLLLIVLIALIVISGSLYIFPVQHYYTLFFSMLLIGIALALLWAKELSYFVASVVTTAISLNLFLNVHFYPELMQYQGGIKAAQYAKAQNIQPSSLYYFQNKNHDFEFYYGHIVPFASDSFLQHYHGWVYSEADVISYLQYLQIPIKNTVAFNHYPVQLLNWKFLNPKTRPKTLKKVYLVEI